MQAERYLPMLSAVIAHSQIVVMLPDAATAQRLPANFDAVDIAILEWIAAEGRRLAPVYSSDPTLTTHSQQTH
jgi:hypothetical protein